MSTVNPTAFVAPTPAPAWALSMRRFNDWLLGNIGGGPRPLKFAWVINFQKGGTFLFLGALMWFYSSRSPAATGPGAWIYVALHGSYGLTWLLKDLNFPDPHWQNRITIGASVAALCGLGLYWSFGWLLISGTAQPHYPLPEAAWFCLCISLCICGSTIMVVADAQKFYTLRLKRGLITDGVFKYVRHPNYLGEMMIYGAFALLVWHWLPVLVLAYIWGGMFSVNMAMKEASMSRYPEWAAYKKRSWWLVPYLVVGRGLRSAYRSGLPRYRSAVDDDQQQHLHHQPHRQHGLGEGAIQLRVLPHPHVGGCNRQGQQDQADAGGATGGGHQHADGAQQLEHSADVDRMRGRHGNVGRHDGDEEAGPQEMADAAEQEPGADDEQAYLLGDRHGPGPP